MKNNVSTDGSTDSLPRTKLRITLLNDGTFKYDAEVYEDKGRYYYRAVRWKAWRRLAR